MADEPTLRPAPLEAETFAPFGQVVQAAPGGVHRVINDGYADRFDDLARVHAGGGGRVLVSIFRARPRTLPLRLALMERHVLGSQLFMPLGAVRFIVVVAPPGPAPQVADLRCFIAGPGQGVNLDPGTWHHPLLALDEGDFLVVDRGATDGREDCDVVRFTEPAPWLAA